MDIEFPDDKEANNKQKHALNSQVLGMLLCCGICNKHLLPRTSKSPNDQDNTWECREHNSIINVSEKKSY